MPELTERDTWHAMPVEQVLSALETSSEGLDETEAERRLEVYGANAIGEEKGPSAISRFLEQFRSPLIYILLVASVISFVLGEYIDGWVILVIVIFNAVIGFVQEYKAERALAALRELAAPAANVVRSGEPREIQADRLVPGDVVAVEAGDKVPADGRIIDEARLKVEEAALTGESVPVDKHTSPIAEDTSLADRDNMLYAGTTVASGRGRAVIVATGSNTRTGQIAAEVAAAPSEETPVQRKLGQIGQILAIVGVAIAAFLVVVGLLRGLNVYDLFFTAVAIAVAFIPEGLPALVTIVLAIGVQRMARRRAIIRKLPAVETLGSATVICTDKTGTLTENEMTVKVCWTHEGQYTVSGEGYRPEGEFLLNDQPVDADSRADLQLLLTIGTLANDSDLVRTDDQWNIHGDPTEGAIVVAARKAGIRKPALNADNPRIDEIPFESEARYMVTLNRPESGPALICVKGAPERIIEMCKRVRANGEDVELTDGRRAELNEVNKSLASKAYRVLAIAYKEVPREQTDLSHADAESGLVFVGMVGMIDPPRKEVFDAVAEARQAGIRVIMITGDNPITAKAIAYMLGIGDSEEAITGRELERMTDSELDERIRQASVFARVEPQHKYRIVEALKRQGAIVGMTGDGVNDAPALKRADIGISMGITGTDVARESSDMVLADDNFATIIGAVEEGRVIFTNLRKVVQYLLATNSGEVLTFIVAILAGFPLPLIPVQILWVNLVTDGFATAPLALEPREGDVLSQPPREPGEPVITRPLMWRLGMVAIIMTAGTLGLFLYELSTAGILRARTMAFATLAIFQLFNTFNVRSATKSIFSVGLLSNPYILLGVGASFVLQILVIHADFLQPIFQTVALRPIDWILVIAVSSTVLIVEEIRKAVAPNLFQTPSTRTSEQR